MCLPTEKVCVSGKGTVTVMLWVKMTGEAQNAAGDAPFTMGQGGTCSGWNLRFRRSGGHAADYILSNYCSVNLPGFKWQGADFNKWLHITVVVDEKADQLRFYVDGSMRTSAKIPNWKSDNCIGDCRVAVVAE